MGNQRNAASDQDHRTLRLRYGRLIAASGWVLSGASLAYQMLSTAGGLQDWAPWLLLISWLLYALQFRPATTITPTELHITNGLRSHHIPWNAIEDVTVRHPTAVVVGGRRHTCWGAPTAPSGAALGMGMARDFSARPSTALPSDERLSLPVRTGDGRSSVLDAWRTYRNTETRTPVRSTWNWPSLIAGTASITYFVTAVFFIN